MFNNLFFKFMVIAALVLALIVPLALIDSKVGERQRYSSEAQQEISRMWTGSQSIQGPVVVVPYIEKVNEKVWDKKLDTYVMKEVSYRREQYFFPTTLQADVKIDTEERYKGIYSVPVYTARMVMSGDFNLPAHYGVDLSRFIQWQEAFITIGVSDARGIRSGTQIQWQQKPAEFRPGSRTSQFPQGLHASLGSLNQPARKQYHFNVELTLAGTLALHFLPVADTTEVSAQSTWPHPGFTGDFLPESRQIDENGFNAVWKVSHFATSIQDDFSRCDNAQCKGLYKSQFGVSFVKPVDIYNLTDRSIKYGLLFILLTFCVFFLFEVLKDLRIHPVQYGLVGLALAVFYLLLISLSEHIDFNYAYSLSALSCAALVTYYVAYVLRSVWRALGFGLVLLALYGQLLMILKSEDDALLMGSLLIFSTLSLLMLLTRKVDWYGMGKRNYVPVEYKQ